MLNRFPYRLYLVTDEAACLGRDLIKVTEAAVKGGVDLVQLREKQLGETDFWVRAVEMKAMLDKYGVPLIINDNLTIAKKANCAGIHVGQQDIKPAEIRKYWQTAQLLGLSIEREEEFNDPQLSLVDYIGLSPIYATPTKKDTKTQWKIEGIRRARALTEKPIVAIGGIKAEQVESVMRAGADTIAVVSAICSAPDPTKAAEQLRNNIERFKQ